METAILIFFVTWLVYTTRDKDKPESGRPIVARVTEFVRNQDEYKDRMFKEFCDIRGISFDEKLKDQIVDIISRYKKRQWKDIIIPEYLAPEIREYLYDIPKIPKE